MEVLVRYLIACSLIITVLSCKKDKNTEEIIIEKNEDTNILRIPNDYDKNTIVGLHADIFAPTCANSGCHDGTFAPDFRTIESTYNTLVMHPIVKNNEGNDYAYRVVPRDVQNSMLYVRMTVDIDSISGIMPLYSGEAWDKVKAEHLANITSWINDGAKDIFGTPFSMGNQSPQMQGFIAYASGGVQPLERDPSGTIIIPDNLSEVSLWFSFSDDNTAATDLTGNTIKLNTSLSDYENQPELNLLTGQTKEALGYFPEDGMKTYTHRFTFDPTVFNIGQPVFVRAYVSDDENNVEIPSDGSPDYIKTYFSFKRKDI